MAKRRKTLMNQLRKDYAQKISQEVEKKGLTESAAEEQAIAPQPAAEEKPATASSSPWAPPPAAGPWAAPPGTKQTVPARPAITAAPTAVQTPPAAAVDATLNSAAGRLSRLQQTLSGSLSSRHLSFSSAPAANFEFDQYEESGPVVESAPALVEPAVVEPAPVSTPEVMAFQRQFAEPTPTFHAPPESTPVFDQAPVPKIQEFSGNDDDGSQTCPELYAPTVEAPLPGAKSLTGERAIPRKTIAQEFNLPKLLAETETQTQQVLNMEPPKDFDSAMHYFTGNAERMTYTSELRFRAQFTPNVDEVIQEIKSEPEQMPQWLQVDDTAPPSMAPHVPQNSGFSMLDLIDESYRPIQANPVYSSSRGQVHVELEYSAQHAGRLPPSQAGMSGLAGGMGSATRAGAFKSKWSKK